MTASTPTLATSSIPAVAHSNDYNEEEEQERRRKQRILEEVRNVLLCLEKEESDRGGLSSDNVHLKAACIFRKRKDYLDILFPHLN